jgi:hypothetical protein
LARIAYAATATGDALDSSLGHVAAPAGEFHIKGSGLVVDGRLFAAVKVAAFFPERTYLATTNAPKADLWAMN